MVDIYTAMWIDNGSGPVRNPELTDEEFNAGLAQLKQSNLQALWQACDAYQTQFISSVAIGLLTIGVIQSKPKSMAVLAWTQALWAEYYSRKPLITYDSPASMYDFSSVGPMPYSVPELQVEVLGA